MPITQPEPELRAWLRLSLEPTLTASQIYLLLSQLELPQHVLSASASTLSRFLPPQQVARLKSDADSQTQAAIENTLKWLEQPNHHLLTMADIPVYPASLLNLADPPLLLYVNGRPELLAKQAIAIVGARSATVAGTDNARAFSSYLAQHNWCIISGLAEGIDAAAHEGALQAGAQSGSTIAVMATGIDLVYPARNRQLAHQIAKQGALVSEFPLGTRALPYHFPKRNRIVAALARGVLVVEAALKSGSLITAKQASEIGREVFAIPGSIHSPLSRGCHALIRDGAKLVESGQDIHDELRQPGLLPEPANQKKPVARRTVRETTSVSTKALPHSEPATENSFALLQAMGFDPIDLDTLCERTGMGAAAINSALFELEMAGLVAREDDGRFLQRPPQPKF